MLELVIRYEEGVFVYISKIILNGFRNFKNAEINLKQKSLIIGPNDVGKSNLLFAIRMLLDKNMPESILEPCDSDFYAFEETNTYDITIFLSDIIPEPAKEECIWAKWGKKINSDNTMIIKYIAIREPSSSSKNYELYIGKDLENLEPLENRAYLRVLCLEYVDSNRDLNSFIKREQTRMLHETKELRIPEEIEKDLEIEDSVKEDLKNVNETINSLSYVNKATQSLNEEMMALNFDDTETIEFSAADIDTNKCISNLNLVTKINDKTVNLGGDGRSNQVFITLWTNKNVEHTPLVECAKLYCIEEPEAHLHPHKQRALSKYLTNKFESQIIITSHSPQIACEFNPSNMVKLYNKGGGTMAAQNGCSMEIDQAFTDFGYRLNIIPAEAFFSSSIFLVEGISEVLFYKAYAKMVTDIDIDKLNISILSVEGVGFKPYVNIFCKFNIPVTIRTDNDIFKIKNKEEYRFAGLDRAISIYNEYFACENEQINEKIRISDPNNIPEDIKQKINIIKLRLEEKNIFIADKDFETDIYNSELGDKLNSFYQQPNANLDIDNDDEIENEEVDVIKIMKQKKGINMYKFLAANKETLINIGNNDILKPLYRSKDIISN